LTTAQSPVSLGLEFEFQFFGMLKPPVEIGAGPYGTRLYFEVTEGNVTGERISGRVLSGGGDWILIGPDGWGRLDVRAQFQTHDGAFIFVSYFGVLEMNDGIQQAIQTGAETAYADQYFRIAPRLESGDPRYAWVNQTLFVGEGRAYPGLGVEYRVCRVT
jgi:hypothetical protein